MKKSILLVAMLWLVFLSKAQTDITLSFNTPALASGGNLCLATNPQQQTLTVNVYKNGGQTTSGYIWLIYENVNGVKNIQELDYIGNSSFTSGTGYTKQYTVSINASTFSAGYLNGKLYVQYYDPFQDLTLTSSAYFNYTINKIAVSASTSLCPGSSVPLTASGASSYSWTPSTGLSSTTGSSITASPTSNTIYTVTGIINGCAFSKTTTVSMKNTLAVSPTQTVICPSTSATLTASGVSTSYSWSPSTGLNSTTSASVIASPSTNTVYTVSSTANGCALSKTVTVNVLAPCGSTLSNAINLGSFYTCPMIQTAVYNNSTSNNFGNDYGSGKTNGQPSDDIYFKIYYDSYQGEQTMLTVDVWPENTNFDTYIHLLDANGNWLESNDNVQNSTVYTNSSITRSIYENYYYIVVEGKGLASGNFSLVINAGSDCARKSTDITVTSPEALIFPNPASNEVSIALPYVDIAGEITLYNIKGEISKVIYTTDQYNTIPVGVLPSGLYFVSIKQGSFIKNEKLIIQ